MIFNSKGFLFTISILIFASTIVFFAQTYSSKSIEKEYFIISGYRAGVEPVINDDLALDLKNLTGVEFSLTTLHGSDFNLSFAEEIPKKWLRQSLVDYNSFVNTVFFERVAGNQRLDLSDMIDGNVLLFFGDYLSYIYDPDTNSTYFFPLKSNSLQDLDLNMHLAGGGLVSKSWTPVAGSVPVRLFYEDDMNSFTFSSNIDPSQTSTLLIEYGSETIEVLIGDVESRASAIKIDSNTVSVLKYSANISWADFDEDSLPVYFNAILSHNQDRVDSNSYLLLRK